jgi:tRNA-specific 2-thiouridylase
VDEAVSFERAVIDYFTAEYRAGRTPNPCVMCNEKVKFGNLWNKAKSIGAEYIATGHYAIVEHHGDRAVLRRGVDPNKDQSYFLFSLRQPQLLRSLFPLGGMEKPEIRASRANSDSRPRTKSTARKSVLSRERLQGLPAPASW